MSDRHSHRAVGLRPAMPAFLPAPVLALRRPGPRAARGTACAPFLFVLILTSPVHAAYAGDEACRRCHASQYDSFRRTGMARSVAKPDLKLPDFAQAAQITAKRDGQSYRSYIRDGKAYHASGAGETHELIYAIGSGDHGRSYAIARGDALFLSPLSYYSGARKWDLSPGYAAGLARDFTRPVTAECLGCHSSLPRATAIGCESCHGPGEAHAARPAAPIVNPARLAPPLRDDVCNRCHLGGDIRIARPGKSEGDFRPGTPLDEVVSVFSIPAAMKRGGSEVLGQTGQLRSSRCWTASAGRMGCISCHDPHTQPRGAEAAAFYRSRCLNCHQTRSCTEKPAARRAAADNCAACHMPPSPLAGVAHTAHTDHRILKVPEAEDPFPRTSRRLELVWETGRGEPDPRVKALAHAEAARGIPALADTSRALLSEAARLYPGDADVQSAWGLASGDRAALERALALGARPVEVRRALASKEGNTARAAELLEQACKIAPFDAAAHLDLARVYGALGRGAARRAILDRVRSFDPANPDLRGLE